MTIPLSPETTMVSGYDAFLKAARACPTLEALWKLNLSTHPERVFLYVPDGSDRGNASPDTQLGWYKASYAEVESWISAAASKYVDLPVPQDKRPSIDASFDVNSLQHAWTSDTDSVESRKRFNRHLASAINGQRLVAFWSEPSPALFVTMLAVRRRGLVPFMITPTTHISTAIDVLFRHVRPTALFHSTRYAHQAAEVLKATKLERAHDPLSVIHLPEDNLFFKALADKEGSSITHQNKSPALTEHSQDTLLALLHTSTGSYAVPKLVPVDHTAMIRATSLFFDYVPTRPSRIGTRPMLLNRPTSNAAILQAGMIAPLLYGESVAFPRGPPPPCSNVQTLNDLIALDCYQYFSDANHFLDLQHTALVEGPPEQRERMTCYLREMDFYLVAGRVREDIGRLAQRNGIRVRVVGGSAESNSIFSSRVGEHTSWSRLRVLPGVEHTLSSYPGTDLVQLVMLNQQRNNPLRVLNHPLFATDALLPESSAVYCLGDLYAITEHSDDDPVLRYYGRTSETTKWRGNTLHPNLVEYAVEEDPRIQEAVVLVEQQQQKQGGRQDDTQRIALLVHRRPAHLVSFVSGRDIPQATDDELKQALSDLANAAIGCDAFSLASVILLPDSMPFPRNYKGLIARSAFQSLPQWVQLADSIFPPQS